MIMKIPLTCIVVSNTNYLTHGGLCQRTLPERRLQLLTATVELELVPSFFTLMSPQKSDSEEKVPSCSIKFGKTSNAEILHGHTESAKILCSSPIHSTPPHGPVSMTTRLQILFFETWQSKLVLWLLSTWDMYVCSTNKGWRGRRL